MGVTNLGVFKKISIQWHVTKHNVQLRFDVLIDNKTNLKYDWNYPDKMATMTFSTIESFERYNNVFNIFVL